MAVDPLHPRGNFGHYDISIRQCIRHKIRHVSLLRSVAFSCNITITYVTFKMLKDRLVSKLQYFEILLYTSFSVYVLISCCDDFIHSMLPKQKSVTNIDSCYIRYIILYRYVNLGFCTILMNGNHS